MRMDKRLIRRMRRVATAARYGTTDPHRKPAPPPQVTPVPTPKSLSGVDYEGAWDKYAATWRGRFPDAEYLGDEWQGTEAGAAENIVEYVELIERTFIAPYVKSDDHVLEIGVGGGRTALLLRNRAAHVTCADISAGMLRAARERLGDERMSYVKLDGRTLEGIPDASIDFLFCFDTLVHMEPRDIFNYLVRIPTLMRGRRLVLLHHGDMLTERGWDPSPSAALSQLGTVWPVDGRTVGVVVERHVRQRGHRSPPRVVARRRSGSAAGGPHRRAGVAGPRPARPPHPAHHPLR